MIVHVASFLVQKKGHMYGYSLLLPVAKAAIKLSLRLFVFPSLLSLFVFP